MLHASERSSGCSWTVGLQNSVLLVGFLVVVCVCDEKGWSSAVMGVGHISVSGGLCSEGGGVE